MQMWWNAAGVAALGDQLTGRDVLTEFDEELREVHVDRAFVVCVTDPQPVSAARVFELSPVDDTIGRGEDREDRALVDVPPEVDAAVVGAIRRPEPRLDRVFIREREAITVHERGR